MNSGRAENAEAHIQKSRCSFSKKYRKWNDYIAERGRRKVYEEVTMVRPKDEPNEEVSIWPELADRLGESNFGKR